jgi:hypothetical protein
MNILFINPAWDAAGCSYRQAAAINKYTTHKARHFRAVKTFYDTMDIGSENYNRDEFVTLIEQSDILHFCSATHDYPSPQNWGFNWTDFIGRKKKIFHDYNSFAGYWGDRAKAKDVWNKRKEIGYDAIFSSIPQAVYIYDECVYVPDLVDDQDPWFQPGENRDMTKLNLCHFPTGGGNNKNTNELMAALHQLKMTCSMIQGAPNKEVLNLKKTCNFGFDALWRGFHGATSVENLAMGIPTMCNIETEFSNIFKIYFKCDEIPFENVKNVDDIVRVLIYYSNDNAALRDRCDMVRKFMVEKWSAKNIAENIIKEYEKL